MCHLDIHVLEVSEWLFFLVDIFAVGNVVIYYFEFNNMKFFPSFYEVEVPDTKAL